MILIQTVALVVSMVPGIEASFSSPMPILDAGSTLCVLELNGLGGLILLLHPEQRSRFRNDLLPILLRKVPADSRSGLAASLVRQPPEDGLLKLALQRSCDLGRAPRASAVTLYSERQGSTIVQAIEVYFCDSQKRTVVYQNLACDPRACKLTDGYITDLLLTCLRESLERSDCYIDPTEF